MIYSFIALSESIDKKSGEGNAKWKSKAVPSPAADARRRRSLPASCANQKFRGRISSTPSSVFFLKTSKDAISLTLEC